MKKFLILLLLAPCGAFGQDASKLSNLLEKAMRPAKYLPDGLLGTFKDPDGITLKITRSAVIQGDSEFKIVSEITHRIVQAGLPAELWSFEALHPKEKFKFPMQILSFLGQEYDSEFFIIHMGKPNSSFSIPVFKIKN